MRNLIKKKKTLDSSVITVGRVLSTLYFLYEMQKNTFMKNDTVFPKTQMEVDK